HRLLLSACRSPAVHCGRYRTVLSRCRAHRSARRAGSTAAFRQRSDETRNEEAAMAGESVYRATDLVGTSKTSWEDAVKNAIQTASKSLRELRGAEVSPLDLTTGQGND